MPKHLLDSIILPNGKKIIIDKSVIPFTQHNVEKKSQEAKVYVEIEVKWENINTDKRTSSKEEEEWSWFWQKNVNYL